MVVSENPNPETQSLLEKRFASPRTQTIQILIIIVGILSGLIALGLLARMSFEASFQWQIIVLLFANATNTVYAIYAVRQLSVSRNTLQIAGTAAGLFGIAMLSIALLMKDINISAAIIYLVYALIFSTLIENNASANRTITYGIIIAALCAVLPEIFLLFFPLPQISIPYISTYTPAILGILFMIYTVLLLMQFVTATLRIRLVTAFLAIVIIPLTILAFSQSQFTSSILHSQTDQALLGDAEETAERIDSFIAQGSKSLRKASKFEVFYDYIALSPEERLVSRELKGIEVALSALDIDEIDNTAYMTSYALLDIEGWNLYDTYSNRTRIGSSQGSEEPSVGGQGTFEGNQDYFLIPVQTGTEYISPMIIGEDGKAFLFISSPIVDDHGSVVGVLRARYDGLILQQIISEFGGKSGMHSYAMLLDEYNIRLADGFTPSNLYKSLAPLPNSELQAALLNNRLPDLPAEKLSTQLKQFDRLARNYEQENTFSLNISATDFEKDSFPEEGAIAPLETRPWKVVYLIENFDEASYRQNERTLVTFLATMIAALVGFIAVGVSQVLSRPIVQLMETSQKITQGDLTARAPAASNDEFGQLGFSFNLMTDQVRTLIGELEERVKARTNEIENQNVVLTERARQLQTVSDVARQIVSVQELESLLTSITKLVSERFNFYHVGIFLLDENKEFAILRAANSEGGQRMLARSHMLPVGKVGIVGNVTGAGEPRIATDVGDDATYFNNPDLPLTRSEMALPLKVGGQIIGAIDIQSVEPNAFQQDDIELFTTLADQIAIAIYNNQLFAETARALNEAQTLHREYLNEEWQKEVAARRVHGYSYNRLGVSAQHSELPEWESVIESGSPLVEIIPGENGEPDHASIAMPISVRGETIGVIHVQDSGIDRYWSEDEVAVVNDVANQVAVALENARLFEATVRRADREKKVLEITQHIRSTNEPDRMMQIAINELQRVLGATRAQIYVRRAAGADENPEGSNGSDGKGHTPTMLSSQD